jgi:transposase-like protein
MRHCPDCHADQVIKNGSNATGKPKYACKACGRQFVDDPAWRVISDEIKVRLCPFARQILPGGVC